MFSFKQGPACCCCWSCLICSCAKAKHARSTVLTCLTSPWNHLETCFSSHHAVPLHFWPFLDNVHWVCKYYGGVGLVAKSCLAVATPWTVAGQAPKWNLHVRDRYTVLSKRRLPYAKLHITQTLCQRDHQLLRCRNRRKDQFCEISKIPKKCNNLFNFLSFLFFCKFPK